jgi:hypothetical protein
MGKPSWLDSTKYTALFRAFRITAAARKTIIINAARVALQEASATPPMFRLESEGKFRQDVASRRLPSEV